MYNIHFSFLFYTFPERKFTSKHQGDRQSVCYCIKINKLCSKHPIFISLFFFMKRPSVHSILPTASLQNTTSRSVIALWPVGSSADYVHDLEQVSAGRGGVSALVSRLPSLSDSQDVHFTCWQQVNIDRLRVLQICKLVSYEISVNIMLIRRGPWHTTMRPLWPFLHVPFLRNVIYVFTCKRGVHI